MDIEVTGALLETDPQMGKEMVGMTSRSAELYEVLCMLTTGDAKTLIRNIISADGLVAWQTLRKTYCRQTLAKSLRKFRNATSPKQVKNTGDIIGALAKWEGDLQEPYKKVNLWWWVEVGWAHVKNVGDHPGCRRS